MEERSAAARLCQLGAVVSLVTLSALLITRAYFDSTYAVAFDARVSWTAGVCASALLLGHLVAMALGRRSARFAEPPGPVRHLLALCITALAASAMTHVSPQDTIEAIRAEVPPTLGPLYPLLCFVSPLLLRGSSRTLDAADQALLALLAIGTTSAVLFLDGGAMLALASVTLLLQLGAGGRLPRPGGWLVLSAGAVFVCFFVSTLLSDNPLIARPAMRWIGAAALTALAVGARPRNGDAWIRLLAAPVAAATLVALCDVALTTRIATQFGISNALDTRLQLFRQHPNFLASLYAFHAVLATALLGVRTRARWFGVTAFVFLVLATWHTDSNAGKAGLALGLAAIPVVWALSAIARRFGGRVVAIGSISVVALLLAGIGAAVSGALGVSAIEGRVDRFQKSFEFRIAAWTNAANVIRENPVVGVGPHVFVAETPYRHGTRFASEPSPPHPHDVPLYVAQAGGVPALGAFLIWMVILLARQFRLLTRARDDGTIPGGLVLGTLAATGGLLAATVFDLGLALDTIVPWPLWWVSGLFLIDHSTRREPALPGPGLFAMAATLLVFFIAAVPPIRARIEISRSRLLAADGPRIAAFTEARELQLAALRRAVELDPSLEDGYIMLDAVLSGSPEERLELLNEYRRQAPDYGHVRSRVGRLLAELGSLEHAADALSYAVVDRYWSETLLDDRARYVRVLGQLGRRDEAEAALKSAIISDHSVVNSFEKDEEGRPFVEMLDEHGDPADGMPIADVLDTLSDGLTRRRDGGHEVARRDWMQLFLAYRATGLDEEAEAYLDFLDRSVAEIEPESILRERGRLASDRGDRAAAVRIYREAHRITGIESFLDFAREAGTRRAAKAAPRSLAFIGDLMAWQPAYELALGTRIDAAFSKGAPLDAAEDLDRRLFFVIRPIDRARILVRKADALAAGRAPSSAVLAALREALENLFSKRYSLQYLSVRLEDSFPGHIAASMVAQWDADGLEVPEMEAAALAIDDARGASPAALLFRIGLWRETGNAEGLLRDARMLTRLVPDSDFATHAELIAREILDPVDVVRRIARDRVLLRILHPTTDPPTNPVGQAIEKMMTGDYGGASTQFRALFQGAGAGRESSTVLEWWARARLLDGSPDEAGLLITRALKSDPGHRLNMRRAEAWK